MASRPGRIVPDCSAVCREIQAAGSQVEVMEIVSGYLSSLDDGALASIPVSLASLQASQAREIAAAAVDLARHEMTMAQDAPEAAVVKNVATVLSTAAMRLALLST
jgi:hypothetical protein